MGICCHFRTRSHRRIIREVLNAVPDLGEVSAAKKITLCNVLNHIYGSKGAVTRGYTLFAIPIYDHLVAATNISY